VVSSTDKEVTFQDTDYTKKEMEDGNLNMTNYLPYTEKTIMAFQSIGGAEVSFMGFIVQEYGSHCSDQNSRRVYLSFLDTVKYMQPAQYQTEVYHQIIIEYLKFVKSLGYQIFHLYSDPPSQGDDYIFHGHPSLQKIPDKARLCQWYKLFFAKAVEQGVVADWMNSYTVELGPSGGLTEISDRNRVHPACLPYFQDCIWTQSVELAYKDPNKCKVQDKLEVLLKAYPYFFVASLQSTGSTVIEDPDENIRFNIFAFRKSKGKGCLATSKEPTVETDDFVTFAKNCGHGFETLSRAQITTQIFLDKLHAVKQ